jgi:hypothetical protein
MGQRTEKVKTIEVWKENIEGQLRNIGFDNDFLDMILKAGNRRKNR